LQMQAQQKAVMPGDAAAQRFALTGSLARVSNRPLCRWRRMMLPSTSPWFHAPRVGKAGGGLTGSGDVNGVACRKRHRANSAFDWTPAPALGRYVRFL
jgi:hypothetical protein